MNGEVIESSDLAKLDEFGLRECHWCRARYTPSPDWVLVRAHYRGTCSPQYGGVISKIAENHCPVCDKPNNTAPVRWRCA